MIDYYCEICKQPITGFDVTQHHPDCMEYNRLAPPDRVEELEAENTKLKRLNREMVEVLCEIIGYVVSSEEEEPIVIGCHCTDVGHCVWCRAKQVLAKAEGES